MQCTTQKQNCCSSSIQCDSCRVLSCVTIAASNANRECHLPDALHELSRAAEPDATHPYVFKCRAHILDSVQLMQQVRVACRDDSLPVE